MHAYVERAGGMLYTDADAAHAPVADDVDGSEPEAAAAAAAADCTTSLVRQGQHGGLSHIAFMGTKAQSFLHCQGPACKGKCSHVCSLYCGSRELLGALRH